MAKFISEIAGVCGNYFKVEADGLKRTPCFSRFLAEITIENGKKYWLIETLKKITGKNPEWNACFESFQKLTLISRSKYVDLMRVYSEEGLITHQEGVPTFEATGSRSVGLLNKDVERETAAANRKRKLMDQMKSLAESKNWIQSKYEMLLDDPEILHKWNVVKEGASLIRLMNQKEQNLEWAKNQKLRQWQAQLLSEIDVHGHNDRKIFWIMDERGSSGKTWFTKYMHNLDPEGTAWLQNGKTHDLIKAIVDQASCLKLVLFDLCRSNEERINWDVIERVKNGMLMSTKYEVESTIIQSPTVVCFANFEPDLKKLSMDRWVVYEIIDQSLYSRAVVGSADDPHLAERKECAMPLDDLMASIGVEWGKTWNRFSGILFISMGNCYNLVESIRLFEESLDSTK